jgi:hypothetical protein
MSGCPQPWQPSAIGSEQILLFRPFHDFETLQKRYVIRRLLILSRIVHEPNAIQTVLAAVIPDTKPPANIGFPAFGHSISAYQLNDRAGRDDV